MLTETHADLFTNIANETDPPFLTSFLQLSSISHTLNKVEENNLSHKDDLLISYYKIFKTFIPKIKYHNTQ